MFTGQREVDVTKRNNEQAQRVIKHGQLSRGLYAMHTAPEAQLVYSSCCGDQRAVFSNRLIIVYETNGG